MSRSGTTGTLAPVEHVACDLCGADDPEPRLTERRWKVVRCRRCSLVYLTPRPDPRSMHRDYDWHRSGLAQMEARRTLQSPARAALRAVRTFFRSRRRREAVVRRRIRRLVPAGRFLDVGCGDGAMVAAMADAGFDAHGIDPSPAAVAEARRRGSGSVLEATLEEAPFPERHFDVILMMSSLEHEHRPTAAVLRARDLLRPGGHLFVKAPHYGSLNRVALGRRWSGYFFPHHLYYFTPRTVASLFRKCGLEPVPDLLRDHVPLSDVFWAVARRPGSRDETS